MLSNIEAFLAVDCVFFIKGNNDNNVSNTVLKHHQS